MTSGVASASRWSGTLASAVGLACLYVVAFALASRSASYSGVGAFAVVPTVGLLGLAAAIRLARRETDAVLRRMVLASFLLKLIAAFVMYAVTFGIYRSGDAQLYHVTGQAFAEGVWDGEFGRGLWSTTGTGFLQMVTGLIYVVTGPTRLGGFVVFSTLSWLGLYLFFRALPAGITGPPRHLYAALVLFLPSLLIWPSTIGKEAWMMLTLGATAYGARRLLHEQRGLVWLAAGLAGAAVVRPHMAVLVLAGLAVAAVASRPGGSRGRTAVGRGLVVVVLLVAGALVATQVQEFFQLDEITAGSTEAVMEKVRIGTAIGGSEFQNAAVRSPAAIPLAMVSVIFRPFPFEAETTQALVASFEGVLLAGLLWWRRRSLMALPQAIRRMPYLAFAAAYSVGFVIAFSNFNNFGLLARERTQLFPLLFVLLVAGATEQWQARSAGSVRSA